VTTPPAAPGFHYYWFVLDGVAVNDPSSETFFGYGKPTSGVDIPEPGVDFYEAKDVPHGDETRSPWPTLLALPELPRFLWSLRPCP